MAGLLRSEDEATKFFQKAELSDHWHMCTLHERWVSLSSALTARNVPICDALVPAICHCAPNARPPPYDKDKKGTKRRWG